MKNTNLPLWAYILILIVIVLVIGYIIFEKIRKKIVLNKRRERKLARQAKEKAAMDLLKQQQKMEKQALKENKKAARKQ